MKKFKYSIIFLLIFMIIGYATISVSLKLGGNANILGDLDDFKVYISNVVVNGKLTYGTYHNFLIIRPVITINKKYIS